MDRGDCGLKEDRPSAILQVHKRLLISPLSPGLTYNEKMEMDEKAP